MTVGDPSTRPDPAVDWERFQAEQIAAFEEFGRPDEPRPPRPRRVVRQRPSARYDTPEELWAWHVVRMKVVVLWTLISTLGSVCTITAVIFYVELF